MQRRTSARCVNISLCVGAENSTDGKALLSQFLLTASKEGNRKVLLKKIRKTQWIVFIFMYVVFFSRRSSSSFFFLFLRRSRIVHRHMAWLVARLFINSTVSGKSSLRSVGGKPLRNSKRHLTVFRP